MDGRRPISRPRLVRQWRSRSAAYFAPAGAADRDSSHPGQRNIPLKRARSSLLPCDSRARQMHRPRKGCHDEHQFVPGRELPPNLPISPELRILIQPEIDVGHGNRHPNTADDDQAPPCGTSAFGAPVLWTPRMASPTVDSEKMRCGPTLRLNEMSRMS